jgi:hypothetical protein
MIAQKEREGKRGCPLRDEDPQLTGMLPPGVELDVLDGDTVEGELEVVDSAHDGGVEAVGEDLGGERIWGHCSILKTTSSNNQFDAA